MSADITPYRGKRALAQIPKHVVHFSGGSCSWAAGKRVVERHGLDGVILLFADVKYEDEDTYRYLAESAANIGAPLVTIADGRNPWEVFHDERMLGNSRFDPCSKILKRQLLDRWVRANCDADTVHHFGIHSSEIDRFLNLRARMAPTKVSAPLCERPIMGLRGIQDWEAREGLRRQKLYEEGFPHANCGGRCVKQGQAGWALLLRRRPDSFAECERKEQEMRDFLGKNVSMLKERTGGESRPLTLATLRARIEAGVKTDEFDFGGCACAIEEPAEEDAPSW